MMWCLRFLLGRCSAGLIVALALAVGLQGTSPARAQQELPLEVRIDLALVELDRAVRGEDPAAILATVDHLRALSPSLATGELLFIEAEAAIAQDDLDRAEAALTQFVATVGRGSESYTEALGMMLDLPRLRSEQAAREAAEAAAERARQQEAERQRQLRLQQERERQAQARLAAARAEERRVLNSLEVIRDVRFALYRTDELMDRYSICCSRLSQPTTLDEPLHDFERNMLAEFLRDPLRRHVDRAALEALRQSPFFRPLEAFQIPEDWQQHAFGDWVAYRTQSNVSCVAYTVADEFPNEHVFQVPTISVRFEPEAEGDLLRMNLLWNSTFGDDLPVTLRADERSFVFRTVRGDYGGLSAHWAGMTRAFQAARRIEISGTDMFINQPLTIGFSAMGFTAALRRAAEMCGRAGDLHHWLQLR